jgi:hypothetical protein
VYRRAGCENDAFRAEEVAMQVVDVLTSDAFLQAFFLLVVTAALTGLLVPLVKARVDDRKFREQKVFESALARQSKVIESQAELLDSLADLLWSFLLLSLGVTYYATLGDKAKLKIAWTTYDSEAWSYFGKLRAEISKARRLTSPEIHAELLSVYEQWIVGGFDYDLTQAVKGGSGTSDEVWKELHFRIFDEGTARIDDVLNGLAEELRFVQGA